MAQPQSIEERVSYLEGQQFGERMDRIEDRIQHLETTTTQRFNEVTQRFTSLEDKIDRRFEAMDDKMDRRFEFLEARIHRVFITMGIGFSVLVALMTIFKFAVK